MKKNYITINQENNNAVSTVAQENTDKKKRFDYPKVIQ